MKREEQPLAKIFLQACSEYDTVVKKFESKQIISLLRADEETKDPST
jgi:hypothetical protein